MRQVKMKDDDEDDGHEELSQVGKMLLIDFLGCRPFLCVFVFSLFPAWLAKHFLCSPLSLSLSLCLSGFAFIIDYSFSIVKQSFAIEF